MYNVFKKTVRTIKGRRKVQLCFVEISFLLSLGDLIAVQKEPVKMKQKKLKKKRVSNSPRRDSNS